MTEKKWIVHDEAVDRGPYSNHELRQLVQELRVVQSTKISRIDDESLCYEAGKVKGLFRNESTENQIDDMASPNPPLTQPPKQMMQTSTFDRMRSLFPAENQHYNLKSIAVVCFAISIPLLALMGLLWPTIKLLVSMLVVISLSATAYFAFHWLKDLGDSEKNSRVQANRTRTIVSALVAVYFLVVYGFIPQSVDLPRGAKIVPPEKTSSADFDKIKRQTISAWQSINAASQELNLSNQQNLSSKFARQAFLLSQCSLEDVDSSLQEYILASVDQFKSSSALWSNLERKIAEVQGQAQTTADVGNLFGALAGDGTNSQRDAAAGEVFFGLIGAAYQQDRVKEILREYSNPMKAHENAFEQLAKDRISLAKQLEEKFGVPFIISN